MIIESAVHFTVSVSMLKMLTVNKITKKGTLARFTRYGSNCKHKPFFPSWEGHKCLNFEISKCNVICFGTTIFIYNVPIIYFSYVYFIK